MKLYAGEYSRIDYNEELALLETVWMPRSSELTKEEVKLEMKRFLTFILERKPRSIIADTRFFGFNVDNDLQQWIVLHYISRIIDSHTSKYAILVTEELFPVVSKNFVHEEDLENFD